MLNEAIEEAIRKVPVWSPAARVAGTSKPSIRSSASGQTSPTAPMSRASTPKTAIVHPAAERGNLITALPRPDAVARPTAPRT